MKKSKLINLDDKKDNKICNKKNDLEISTNLPTIPNSNEVIIECITCSARFTEESFEQHVCDYDEDGKLIDEPNTLSACAASVIELLKFNETQMSVILREQFKIDVDKLKHAGPFDCDKCDRRFVYYSGLQRHLQKHLTEIDLSRPDKIQTLQVVIKCMECGQIFASIKGAVEHFESCHMDARTKYVNLPCDGIDIKTIANLQDAPLNIVVEQMKYLKVIATSAVLQCEFCNVVFTKTGDLFHHMSQHDSRGGFHCVPCGISLPTVKEINMHWQIDCVFCHFETSFRINVQRAYVCNVCEEEFHRLEDLYYHRYVTLHFFLRKNHANGDMELPCEKCDFFACKVENLVEHHTKEHTKKVITHRNAKQNVSSKKPRPHLCEVCGKSYTQSSHLWQHLRFHQGIKPFACPIEDCDRRFTIRPDLNDHIRKCHTKERPYHCQLCGKRFLTGSVFYQHRLIHRGERRYGCSDCGKRFYRADALKNHQRIHSGEKPYPCQHCTKSFRQRGDREKHIRARHKFLPPTNIKSNAVPFEFDDKIDVQKKDSVGLAGPSKKQERKSRKSVVVEPIPAVYKGETFVGGVKVPKSMFLPILPSISP